jgi:AcrR family transcriptional regulator
VARVRPRHPGASEGGRTGRDLQRQGHARLRRLAAQATPRRRARRGTRPGRGARRNRAETIDAILAATTDLIARKGPDGFGLAELGAEAGVSFGLIHRYFGGKNGLLKEALRQPFTRQLARVLALYERGEARRGPGPLLASLFEAQRRNPRYVRLLAWGLLTGLLTTDVFAADREPMERLLALHHEAARPPRSVDTRAVSALALTATLGFGLFEPLLRALFDVGDDFETVYRRHVERALASFRAPARPRVRSRRRAVVVGR